MKHQREFPAVEPYLVDAIGLQQLCGCGQYTAIHIGNAAGARIKVGRRVLYNTDKVKYYLDRLTEDDKEFLKNI